MNDAHAQADNPAKFADLDALYNNSSASGKALMISLASLLVVQSKTEAELNQHSRFDIWQAVLSLHETTFAVAALEKLQAGAADGLDLADGVSIFIEMFNQERAKQAGRVSVLLELCRKPKGS